MGKFYCVLCELSHHDLTNRVQCPTCSRFFCESSIEEMKSIGRDKCPYCDTLIGSLEIVMGDKTLPQQVERKDELEETWFLKTKKLKDLEMYEEANSALDKVLDREPLNANVWFLKAEVLYKLDKKKEAVDTLNKCLKIDLTNFDAWELKIRILGNEENLNEEKTELKSTCQNYLELLGIALKKTPDEAILWFRKGKTLSKLNQNDEAVESFSQAVQLNPKLVEAWTAKAIVLRGQQNYGEALKSINKSIELDSEDS